MTARADLQAWGQGSGLPRDSIRLSLKACGHGEGEWWKWTAASVAGLLVKLKARWPSVPAGGMVTACLTEWSKLNLGALPLSAYVAKVAPECTSVYELLVEPVMVDGVEVPQDQVELCALYLLLRREVLENPVAAVESEWTPGLSGRGLAKWEARLAEAQVMIAVKAKGGE